MIRFIRTVQLRSTADVPAAIGFASEVTAYINKKYDAKMRYGMEIFSDNRMHWQIDARDLSTLETINKELARDADYWKVLENHRHLWMDGTVRDLVVNLTD